MKLRHLFVAPILLALTHTQVQYVDGFQLNQMLAALQRIQNGVGRDRDELQAARANGYVMGVVDALSPVLICVPDGIKAGQLTAMVSKYLTENPEAWSKSADQLIVQSLRPTFPCKKQGAG